MAAAVGAIVAARAGLAAGIAGHTGDTRKGAAADLGSESARRVAGKAARRAHALRGICNAAKRENRDDRCQRQRQARFAPFVRSLDSEVGGVRAHGLASLN
jgi:hypothetical protein